MTVLNVIHSDKQPERWESIIGYEGIYEVSSFGRVKSLPIKRTNHASFVETILRQQIDIWGYSCVHLYKPGQKMKRAKVHRLVAVAFIENPMCKPCVNHKNYIRSDNNISNLEWSTHKENSTYSKHRMQRGTNRHNNRLTEKQVLEIFNSPLEQREIAVEFSVNQGTVAKIKTGQNWSHLTGKKHIVKYSKK